MSLGKLKKMESINLNQLNQLDEELYYSYSPTTASSVLSEDDLQMFDTSSNTDGEEDAMISKQIRSLVSLNRYRPKSEVMIDESDENYLHRRHLTESFDQDSHHSPPSPSVVNRKNNKKFSHSIIVSNTAHCDKSNELNDDPYCSSRRQYHHSDDNNNNYNDSNKRKRSSPLTAAKCMSKNAVVARENRERKKMYIKNLEENVRYLETENDQLKQSKIACELKEKEMRERIIYLESIILNDSHISSVIQKLQMPTQSTSSILTTTQTINDNFTKLKKSSKPLTESSNKKRSINSNSSTTDNHGICVHIKKKCVSLEFCQQCSQKNDNDRIKFPINSK